MQYFFKNVGTALLSLFLATLVWVAAVREQNPPREADYNRSIPVEVVPPATGLVTTDALPETVRVRLLAPEDSWTALAPSKFRAVVDLSELSVGFNDVPIDVAVSDPQIEIVGQTPQVVTVNLQAEQTITLSIQIEVSDTPPLGYVDRTPVAAPAAVTVSGPASLINQIDGAVSEINIDNSKETIEQTRPVVIRDRDNQPIAGLKVEPSEVRVTLPIEQRFGYKDVSVSAVVEGQPATGYWVSNISINPSRLVVVGNPDELSLISGFIQTVPINVNGATEDIVQITPLSLPDGVAIVLPGGETTGASGVEVTVEIATIESGQTIQRRITQQGIDPRYTWVASPKQADVILSGPIPRLQALKPDDTRVIVDLFGLEPGVYQIRPTVFLPDGLQVEAILPDTIEVTIAPAPTPTPTITPTITTTRAISITRTPTVERTATPLGSTATPQRTDGN